ncbi:putative leader peptide [Streptomyces niveus]|uniref:putative leader peptide n=1 Tax=Streptomyces niveus TaxID=193462 RepID=UPI00368F903B
MVWIRPDEEGVRTGAREPGSIRTAGPPSCPVALRGPACGGPLPCGAGRRIGLVLGVLGRFRLRGQACGLASRARDDRPAGAQAVSTVRAGVRTLDGVGHSQSAPVPAQRILTRRRHIDLARVSSAFCCRAA